MTDPAPILAARRLSMAYPGVLALSEVDFDVRRGEVHALIGQNGAGKSTLIKILSGGASGYGGELQFEGKPVRFASPADGLRAGIAVIPQELQLVSTLSAADNICLGHKPSRGLGLIDAPAVAARARQALSLVGAGELADLISGRPIGGLEAGHRQLVAIARALALDARVLIMDEPSSSLGPEEVGRLEHVVRDLAARGAAIVYVSHRLDEVARLADRITVLRDGRRVTTVAAGAIDPREMVRLMAGASPVGQPFRVAGSVAPVGQPFRVAGTDVPVGQPFRVAGTSTDPTTPLLFVEHLSLADPSRPGGYRLRDVSLSVGRGEIVGLAGLVGAGRTDLLLALTGALDRRPTGRITVGGIPYRPDSPATARRAGVVLLPEDRKDQGIFPDLDVPANITISRLEAVSPACVLSPAREKRAAHDLM